MGNFDQNFVSMLRFFYTCNIGLFISQHFILRHYWDRTSSFRNFLWICILRAHANTHTHTHTHIHTCVYCKQTHILVHTSPFGRNMQLFVSNIPAYFCFVDDPSLQYVSVCSPDQVARCHTLYLFQHRQSECQHNGFVVISLPNAMKSINMPGMDSFLLSISLSVKLLSM